MAVGMSLSEVLIQKKMSLSDMGKGNLTSRRG